MLSTNPMFTSRHISSKKKKTPKILLNNDDWCHMFFKREELLSSLYDQQ